VGGEELLYKSPDVVPRPSSWSADGRFLLFTREFARRNIWTLAVQSPLGSGAADPKPQTPARSEFDDQDARWSQDGRYFAYISNSSGKTEVYVRPFDGAQPSGGASMVSKDGGRAVRWRGDGKEILYMKSGYGQPERVPRYVTLTDVTNLAPRSTPLP
jgi:Tol biopolymer transport system component